MQFALKRSGQLCPGVVGPSIYASSADFTSEIEADDRSSPHRWARLQPVIFTAPLQIFPQNGVFLENLA
jgi:hypothetical protein